MRLQYPSVPREYFDFLSEIGWGNVGGAMIYEGLVRAGTIYPSLLPKDAEVVLFGDDWTGYGFGFDLKRNGCLVEVDPDGEVEGVDEDFSNFIGDYVG